MQFPSLICYSLLTEPAAAAAAWHLVKSTAKTLLFKIQVMNYNGE